MLTAYRELLFQRPHSVPVEALRSWYVNTSVSGTMFFLMCWCIRNAVGFYSRVHAAIKPSHYIRS